MNRFFLIAAMFAALAYSGTTSAELEYGYTTDTELVASDIAVNDSGMVITYEGNVGKYGLVHASHQYFPTNEAETKGYFMGTVQSIDETGIVQRDKTVGLWTRKGSILRIYGLDDGNEVVFHISDIDLRTKKMTGKVMEIKP